MKIYFLFGLGRIVSYVIRTSANDFRVTVEFCMKSQEGHFSQELPAERRAGSGRLAICIAFLLAGWLACASTAQASCAYYVVPAHPSSEMSVSRQAMKDSHSQDIPCPCKGQECRANHSQGAVPAVPQVTSDNEMALSAVDGTEWLPSGGLSLIQDLSSPSEAYLLLPDPPPKTHVHSN